MLLLTGPEKNDKAAFQKIVPRNMIIADKNDLLFLKQIIFCKQVGFPAYPAIHSSTPAMSEHHPDKNNSNHRLRPGSRSESRSQKGSKDLLVIGAIGLILLAGFIFFLFKIIGQSEKHVEKVRETKLNYEESLSWRPDKRLSESRIQRDLKVNPRRKKASYKQIELNEKCLEYIGRMVDLEELNLSDSLLEGEWLKHIVHLPLRRLLLGGTKISDKSVPQLAKLSNLKELSLGDTEVSDQGIRELASLKKLDTLLLERSKITDNGVTFLEPLQNLDTLKLAYTKISPRAIDSIAKIKRLRSLNLEGVPLDGAALLQLSKLKKLRSLTIANCSLDDSAMESIDKFNYLYRLNAERNNFGDKTMAKIDKLQKLYQLDIRHCDSITGGAIESFKRNHPECDIKTTPKAFNLSEEFPIGELNEEVKMIEDQIKLRKDRKQDKNK